MTVELRPDPKLGDQIEQTEAQRLQVSRRISGQIAMPLLRTMHVKCSICVQLFANLHAQNVHAICLHGCPTCTAASGLYVLVVYSSLQAARGGMGEKDLETVVESTRVSCVLGGFHPLIHLSSCTSPASCDELANC